MRSEEKHGMHPDRGLRERLERAAEGLVYTSESDRPFEFFSLAGGAAEGVPPGEEFARMLGVPEGTRVEERTVEDFLMRHIETSDPWDTEAQRIRPRYEHLRKVLETELGGARVYRLGVIEIDCYVVGSDMRGNLAGVRTVSVET